MSPPPPIADAAALAPLAPAGAPAEAAAQEKDFARPGSALMVLAAAPFIYGLLLPLALLDAAVSLYQAVCFRLWSVPRVKRSAYVGLSRHELTYLTRAQRVNCAYCSYANGVLAYAAEIASLTEQFWCPIQHPEPPPAPHGRYGGFLPYGQAEGARAGMARLRRAIRAPAPNFPKE
ncbi:MAG: hypothetical protein U1E50_07140 [Caulobacteraceae bacterium]